MVSAQFSTSTINNVVGSDTALVRLFVTGALSPDDLGPGGPDPERLIALEERLRTLLGPGKIIHVEVRLPDGRVIASDQPGSRGALAPISPDFATALGGRTATAGIDPTAASEAMGPALEPASVLREYFPLVTDGAVRGVVGVWRDAGPILTQLNDMRRNVVLVTLSAALVACGALFLVFRGAQGRISRQTQELVDAARAGPADRPTQSRGARRRRGAGGRARPGRGPGVLGGPGRCRQLPDAERDLRTLGRQRRAADGPGGPDARGARRRPSSAGTDRTS